MKSLLLELSMLFMLTACQSDSTQSYSFFVAGHAYGAPSRMAPGLHPPFFAEFDKIRSYPGMEFGIFTGDIVFFSRDSFWNAVDTQIHQLALPVYFAAGNHDQGQKSPYKERYGPTYYHFEKANDLFIVLDPGLNGWNIRGAQMDFLQTQLAKAKSYQHIFVFFHQLLWWSPDNKYASYQPNSLAGRSPEINFWDDVMPLFSSCGRPVYCFAGDVGAHGLSPSFFTERKGQVYLLASGMGHQVKDNYLLVTVDENEKVTIQVKWLQRQELQTVDLD